MTPDMALNIANWRAEGRREGLEEAARVCDSSHVCGCADRIRALASPPAPTDDGMLCPICPAAEAMGLTAKHRQMDHGAHPPAPKAPDTDEYRRGVRYGMWAARQEVAGYEDSKGEFGAGARLALHETRERIDALLTVQGSHPPTKDKP